MTANNTFDIRRFGMYIRYHAIQNYKMILISIFGFSAATFMLLFFVQIANDLRPLDHDTIRGTFLFIFFVTGIIYCGTAFPGLRSKEKAIGWLLLPVSTFEKYIFEFINRILLFLVLMPLLFWMVYLIEGSFVSMIFPSYKMNMTFITSIIFYDFQPPVEYKSWYILLISSLVSLAFIIPLTGATAFMKHPLLKTLLAFAIVFLFHFLLGFFLVQVLELDRYSPRNESILFVGSEKSALIFFTTYSLIINFALIACGYFKIKEREV